MSNHVESTLDWYVDWLKERNPEWTDEQRLEVATGFVTAQQPPQKPAEVEEELDTMTEGGRAQARADERKARRHLTGEELMKILTAPGEIYRKLN